MASWYGVTGDKINNLQFWYGVTGDKITCNSLFGAKFIFNGRMFHFVVSMQSVVVVCCTQQNKTTPIIIPHF